MSYRPEGLSAEQIYREVDVVSAIDLIDKTIDLTIEALKKNGMNIYIKEYGYHNCYVQFLVTVPAKGTLVYIPDMEVDTKEPKRG